MSIIKKSIVYLDIESLLDLRQGFLYLHSEDKSSLADYVLSEEYNYRETDIFDKFVDIDYRDYMKKPDKKILGGSLLTYMLGIVAGKLNSGEVRDKFKGVATVTELWFNVYPFNLSEEELEHIRDLLFVKLGRKHVIEMVYLEPEQLSPMLLADGGFVSAFIYDFSTWTNLHGESIKNYDMKDCPLYFAPVLRIKPSAEELDVIKKTGFRDSFNYMECLMSPLVKATFLPMLFYSNVIVAQKHIDEYHSKAKKDFDKVVEETEIPEELNEDGDKQEHSGSKT